MRWLLLFATGCYSPSIQPGSPCSNDGSCPSGLVCSPASSTCELTAVDAPVAATDRAMIDAPKMTMIDAQPIDAPVSIDAAVATPNAMLVQQTSNQNTSGPGITATLTNKPVAGNLLVMVGANPSRLIDTVTGGAMTWKLLARSNTYTNTEIWVATATSGTTVSFDTTDGDAPNLIWVGEFSHASATADVAGTSTNGTASPASAPQLVTTADDLAIFSVGDGISNTFGTINGWGAGSPLTTGPVTQGVWYQNVKASTTVAPSVTETAHHWDAALAVVRRQ